MRWGELVGSLTEEGELAPLNEPRRISAQAVERRLRRECTDMVLSTGGAETRYPCKRAIDWLRKHGKEYELMAAYNGDGDLHVRAFDGGLV